VSEEKWLAQKEKMLLAAMIRKEVYRQLVVSALSCVKGKR